MKLGFTTLALFMEPNNDIIDLAKKHGFEIIEILAEGPFFEKDNGELLAPNDPLLQEAAKKRIDEYTKTAGISYQLLYTELTIYINNRAICSFNDKQVHKVLERSGIKKKVYDKDSWCWEFCKETDSSQYASPKQNCYSCNNAKTHSDA